MYRRYVVSLALSFCVLFTNSSFQGALASSNGVFPESSEFVPVVEAKFNPAIQTFLLTAGGAAVVALLIKGLLTA